MYEILKITNYSDGVQIRGYQGCGIGIRQIGCDFEEVAGGSPVVTDGFWILNVLSYTDDPNCIEVTRAHSPVSACKADVI